MSLATYIENKNNELLLDGETKIEAITWGYVAGARSATVEFRFGSLWRYGVVTYIAHDAVVYTLSFSAGGTCEMALLQDNQRGLSEFDTLHQILATLRFLD